MRTKRLKITVLLGIWGYQELRIINMKNTQAWFCLLWKALFDSQRMYCYEQRHRRIWNYNLSINQETLNKFEIYENHGVRIQ